MIAETDLILNKKGNIYHLDISKENLSETIILVGDRDRVPLISKYFDKITHKSQHREFVTHTGYIGEKYLTVMSTGMGVGCVEICLNELDAIFNIDFKTREIKKDLTSLNLIRLGTCGAIQEDIEVNSIIVSDYGFGIDKLLDSYEGSHNLYDYVSSSYGMCQIIKGNPKLSRLFSDSIHGITYTGVGFYAPQDRNLRLKNSDINLIKDLLNINYNNSKVVNIEMETSVLYGLSELMGHNAITLCTVVANRITKEFSKNSDKAVDDMIKYFLGKIMTMI